MFMSIPTALTAGKMRAAARQTRPSPQLNITRKKLNVKTEKELRPAFKIIEAFFRSGNRPEVEEEIARSLSEASKLENRCHHIFRGFDQRHQPGVLICEACARQAFYLSCQLKSTLR